MKNEVFHDLFELSYGSKHEKKSLAQYHVLQFNSHYIKRIIVKNFFKKWNVKVRKENSVIQRGFKDFNRNYEYRTTCRLRHIRLCWLVEIYEMHLLYSCIHSF